MRGATLAVGSAIATRAVGVVGTLALTRWVDPGAYGAVSVAVTLVTTANVLTTVGLGQYVASRKEHDPREAAHATALHVALGVAAALAVVAARRPLAAFANAPAAADFVPLLAGGMLLDRLAYVPERVLLRDMDYRAVSGARSASSLAYTVVSVLLALFGAGAGALVAANLARSALKLVLVVVWTDARDWIAPVRPDPRIVARLLRYGLPLTVASVTGFATGNWDNLLVARWFGPEVLGHYNLAYNLADTPATQVGEQAADALVPTFSRQTPAGRRRSFERALLALAMLIAPLAVGLGLVAPTLYDALLEPRWAAGAPMLLVLSVLSVVRPAIWLGEGYLQTIDRTRLAGAIEASKVVFVFGALLGIGRMSPMAACAAIGLGFGATSVLALVLVARADGMRARDLLRTQLAPLRPVLAMAAAVLGARWAASASGTPASARLVLEVTCGAVAYAAATWLVETRVARELLAGARGALGGGSRPIAAIPASEE